MQNEHIAALAGGLLIGTAATIMLIFNGRVTGVSGIINGALKLQKNEWAWRAAFILGLIAGGFVHLMTKPEAFQNLTNRSDLVVAIAGLIVGYGTVLGSGCTSGHGVCGISRLSVRSIAATLTFIISGIVTVAIFNFLTSGHV